MKKTKKILQFTIFVSFIVVLFASLSHAKGKGSSTNLLKGYCCYKGQVLPSSKPQCKQKGVKIYQNKKDAQEICKPTKIYCCLKGNVDHIPLDKCKKNNGKPFETKEEALQKCKPEQVYCCLKGDLKKVSIGVCKKRAGKSYKTLEEVKNNCGWCCNDNKVIATDPKECKEVGGFYSTLKPKVDRQCKKQAQPQCCIKGKLFTYSKLKCKGKHGEYHPSYQEAKVKCVKVDFKGRDRKEIKKPLYYPDHPVLPDLVVHKTSVNKLCLMTVDVENVGGPIDPTDYAQSTVHLSAGPGQISRATKLSDIDDSDKLLNGSGRFTHTTEMRITQPNQATLVWLDTNHKIEEPPTELPNGDDAVLTCKTPLVWCCGKKLVGLFDRKGKAGVGQVTQGECKKLGGTAHKSEDDANAACGIKDQMLPSKSKLPPREMKKMMKEMMQKPTKKMDSSAQLSQARMRLDSVELVERHSGASSPYWPIRISVPNSTSEYTAGDTISGLYRVEISEEFGEIMEEYGLEFGAGQITFYLMAGWDPHTPPFAQTTVTYNPPTKKKGIGPYVPKSILGTFEILIPGDLSHSSNYKILGSHDGSWSFIGSSDPFTIRPLLETRKGSFKKLDRRSGMAMQDSNMAAEQITPTPGGSTIEMSEGPSEMGASAPGPEFPARITSVTDPAYSGDTITIRGEDFGSRQGVVRLMTIPHYYGVPLTCVVDDGDWSETQIRCEIPEHLGRQIREPHDARIYVYPARVEERSRPPLSTEGEAASDEYYGYHYSGSEGPSYPLQISPILPEISSFSSTEVSEGEELEIIGRHFGDEGTLTLSSGGWSSSIEFSVLSWSSTRIRVQIPITAIQSTVFHSAESVVAEVTVVSGLGHRVTADSSITIQRVDDYDLSLRGVDVENYDNDCGYWPNKHPCFNLTPVVRNNGPDKSLDRISIFSDGVDIVHDGLHDIDPPLESGEEGRADTRNVGCDDEDSCRVNVRIQGLHEWHGGDLGNNECTVTITGNGWYACH